MALVFVVTTVFLGAVVEFAIAEVSSGCVKYQ
jgi:hypothetical protein